MRMFLQMASFINDKRALDEEQEQNQIKKRKWVHKAWTNRKNEEEFVTLHKELVDDETFFLKNPEIRSLKLFQYSSSSFISLPI